MCDGVMVSGRAWENIGLLFEFVCEAFELPVSSLELEPPTSFAWHGLMLVLGRGL